MVLLYSGEKRERFLRMPHNNRDIWLIRHAPSHPPGYLYGRKDADIGQIESTSKEHLQRKLAHFQYLCSSPAKRCVRTCHALFPGRPPPHLITAFWEQSFGDWEGLAYPDLPDLGQMSGHKLARFKPPNGESFVDLCARIQPAFISLLKDVDAQQIAIVVHAGVIRSILSLVFDNHPAALKCEIDPLSVTRLRVLDNHQFSVVCINETG